jgi:hypothetical protein
VTDESIRSWADTPYARVYYAIAERMGADFGDVAFLGSWLKLLLGADAAYPLPAPLPRWLDDAMLDRLVASGLIRLVGAESYTVAGLTRERADRDAGRAVGGRVRAATAERNPDGTFASNEASNAPASTSNDQQQASKGGPASTSDPARDETSKRRARAEETGATNPGRQVTSSASTSPSGADPVATDAVAPSRPRSGHAPSKKRTNGHDEDAERHRRSAVDGIARGEIHGVAAEKAMLDYGIPDDEIAARRAALS